MQYISFFIFRIFTFVIGILPFRMLYFFSDFIAFFLFDIIKYRRKVVFDNLEKSFPEKTEVEIALIAKKFYKSLSDITLEAFKGFLMTPAQFKKRYKYLNPELLDEYFDKEQNVMVVGGHFVNWEWGGGSTAIQVKHSPVVLYKPLKNKILDRFVRKQRSKTGANLVSIAITKRVFLKEYDRPAIFMLVADQNPGNKKKAIWVNFLNRDTACLHGVENYCHEYDFPLVYLQTKRIRRGYYELEFSKLEYDKKNYEYGDITRMFMKKIEENILDRPADWLWSHKRWKHSREVKNENL